MEEITQVIFREKAKRSIKDIALYIEESGYPETSEKFSQRLVEFGYSLATFPNKYAVCRFKRFARYNLRCASFERNYIFVYKLVKNELLIYTIAYTKRLK